MLELIGIAIRMRFIIQQCNGINEYRFSSRAIWLDYRYQRRDSPQPDARRNETNRHRQRMLIRWMDSICNDDLVLKVMHALPLSEIDVSCQ